MHRPSTSPPDGDRLANARAAEATSAARAGLGARCATSAIAAGAASTSGPLHQEGPLKHGEESAHRAIDDERERETVVPLAPHGLDRGRAHAPLAGEQLEQTARSLY